MLTAGGAVAVTRRGPETGFGEVCRVELDARGNLRCFWQLYEAIRVPADFLRFDGCKEHLADLVIDGLPALCLPAATAMMSGGIFRYAAY